MLKLRWMDLQAGVAGSEVANIKMGAFYKSRSADVGGAARFKHEVCCVGVVVVRRQPDQVNGHGPLAHQIRDWQRERGRI